MSSVDQRLARIEQHLGIVATPPPPVIADVDELLAQAKALPAEIKVKLLDAMGFRPVGDDHQPDCPRLWGSGLRCNCVPPAAMWSQPDDVDVFRGETWEQQRAKAQQWSREGSHGREKDEDENDE